MKTFAQLGLDSSLVDALRKMGIAQPTAIQEQTIPPILAAKDVLGQSETGSGKTLAYLLPVMQRIDRQQRATQVIILTPTHELGIQIQRVIETLVREAGWEISSLPLIGNVNIARQIEKLKQKPQIIVGSSGRILELIQKKKIVAQTVRTIVLDEADRLLDEQNRSAVKAVIKTALSRTQLLLYSATLSPAATQQAGLLLKNPQVVRVAGDIALPRSVEHVYFTAEQRDKAEVLRKLIRILIPARGLIFINQSAEIETVVEKLNYHGLPAAGIYGSSRKLERQKALEDFRSGKSRLLVASDLAARGLDIKDITHVFNLDLPEDPQLYLHRAGRTGRAGAEGMAVSIVTDREVAYLRRLEHSYGLRILFKDMYQGKIIDSKRRPGRKR